MSELPVVVVGAGAAGAMAAIHAARPGRRVILLERTRDGCVGVVHVALHDLGAAPGPGVADRNRDTDRLTVGQRAERDLTRRRIGTIEHDCRKRQHGD